MCMKIYLQARGSYESLLDLSIWCENNNIDRIGLPDHYIVGKQRNDKNQPAPALDLLTAIAGLVRYRVNDILRSSISNYIQTSKCSS